MSTTKATMLSLESIDRFRVSLSARGKSDNTASAYATDLRVFLTEIDQESIQKDDYEETAENWLTGNRKRIALKTTSRRLTSVRAFAKWAGWPAALVEYAAPHPVPGVPHPLPEGPDGVRRMAEVARTCQQRALVALCGFVGLRISEALNVKVEDIRGMELRVLGKGEKVRYVPISSEAWGLMAEAVTTSFLEGGTDPVIPIADRVARSNVTQMGRRANLARAVSSHDLRATFATAVYDKTKDMRLVQELLGHSSVETTQIYVGVKRAALRDAVEL